MVNPKFSVIVPCYNVEEYVLKCVMSIAEQDYDNLEIICINDGSTDSTLSILRQLQQEIKNVRVIDQKNVGLSGSRNVGIKAATGEYIMFIDSDDWLDADTFAKTFETGFDLIIFSYNRIFKNNIEPRAYNLSGIYPVSEIQRRMIGLIGEELRDPSQANSLAAAWGKIYRTSIIKDNNVEFVDTRIIGTEDALFNLQYLEYCKGTVKIIDKPYYNYIRFNVNSLTAKSKPNLQSQWKELHKRMAVISEGKDLIFQQAYHSRIALSLIGLGLNEMARKDGNIKIYKEISKIIQDPEFKKAIKSLDFHYMPPHWKVLFTLAKYGNAAGVFAMMKLMDTILKRKNN